MFLGLPIFNAMLAVHVPVHSFLAPEAVAHVAQEGFLFSRVALAVGQVALLDVFTAEVAKDALGEVVPEAFLANIPLMAKVAFKLKRKGDCLVLAVLILPFNLQPIRMWWLMDQFVSGSHVL